MDSISQYIILKEKQHQKRFEDKLLDTKLLEPKTIKKNVWHCSTDVNNDVNNEVISNKFDEKTKNKMFIDNLNRMPSDVINIIQSFVPNNVLALLSKKLYYANHSYIRPTINKHKYEEYIRSMVRQDNDFVFHTLLNENIVKWIELKNYYYNGAVYYNYLIFLRSYCDDHGSIKIKGILTKFLEELGLGKNQHKKKTVRYIRWIT